MKPPIPDPPDAFTPLRVAARGMCCSLGFNAAAATAAIQARMNHFRATQFMGAGGQPIVGAALYDTPVWGAERLALMVHSVAQECFDAWPGAGAAAFASVAVMMLCAEPQRPSMPRQAVVEILQGLQGDWGLHPACSVRAYGKGGIAQMLLHAARLLAHGSPSDPAPTHVLLIGVDSLLDAAAIEALQAQERVAGPDAGDGLVPGEGAAAVLLTSTACPEPALWIEAAASAMDPWRRGEDQPLRAQGLTQAMRTAAAMAGTRVADLDFHASGMTGEAWYAREMNLALARSMEQRRACFDHHMVAQYLGETGAASPLLTLAWLDGVMGRPHGGPGRQGLAHFAGDDGLRAALVLRHRAGAAPAARTSVRPAPPSARTST